MDRAILTGGLASPVARHDLVQRLCRGKVVLDIGCVQHRAYQATNTHWLHQGIVDVAEKVTGVDYLPEEVETLNKRGYNILCADVTTPLPLQDQYDVIVVGNLIEHLSSFDGLFDNLRRLVKPDGVVLISTANPFYREQYFFSALKNDIIVNAEHTCWIDPVTLDQLAVRYGFATRHVHWVQGGWKLAQVVLHGRRARFDAVSGRWSFVQPPSLFERITAPFLGTAFRAMASKSTVEAVEGRYGPDTNRMIYMKAIGLAFHAVWRLYSMVIVESRINRHELFVSELRREPAAS